MFSRLTVFGLLAVLCACSSSGGSGQNGGAAQDASFQIERWIDPAKFGWWSGDHHIHAAGCAHYMNPTEGVLPADMVRHTLGEDLKIGATLTDEWLKRTGEVGQTVLRKFRE